MNLTMWRAGAMASVLVLGSAAPALARQDRTVGITAGYPAVVGLLWQISDRLALRPDVTWSWTSTDSETIVDIAPNVPPVSLNSSSHGNTVAFGVSGLWTFRHDGPLRLLIGGRFGYSTTSQETTLQSVSFSFGSGIAAPAPVTTTRTTNSDSHGYAFAGLFGGQYALGSRAAVFAEIGPSYQASEGTNDITDGRNSSHGTGVRSAVGLIFFF